MMIDRDVSVATLLHETLLTAIFKKEVDLRLRPGYFPFVETQASNSIFAA